MYYVCFRLENVVKKHQISSLPVTLEQQVHLCGQFLPINANTSVSVHLLTYTLPFKSKNTCDIYET